MKIRCDRNELAQCLGDILGIIPMSQTTRPIFLYYHLKAQGNNVFVRATDLDIGAVIRLERVEIEEEGEMTLPASRLSSLVREIQDKEVGLEALPEGRGGIVRSEGSEFKLLGEDPREFPQASGSGAESSLTVSREDFVGALRRVAVAASRDISRFQLTGVFFEVEAEALTLTATDGKRLANDHLRVENPEKSAAKAIVPNRVVDVLLKLLVQGDPTVSIAIKDPDIHVNFGRGELTAKVVEGSFPDYRTAFASKVNTRVTAKRAELLAAARTAALMTDKKTATVIFDFLKDALSVSTQSSDIGESRIDVPVSLEGDPVRMRFNPTYLIDALRSLTEDDVRFEFVDGDTAATIRGAQHYRHIVMPLVTD